MPQVTGLTIYCTVCSGESRYLSGPGGVNCFDRNLNAWGGSSELIPIGPAQSNARSYKGTIPVTILVPAGASVQAYTCQISITAGAQSSGFSIAEQAPDWARPAMSAPSTPIPPYVNVRSGKLGVPTR